ncbi:MAG TPA: hypothetical protein VKX39_14610 [Bryobacteraceae bacterium]|jgi:hypothetical protein|nr:hypothetical protein [Bryobacteraceae bacterium]
MLRGIPYVALLTVAGLMFGWMIHAPAQPPPPGRKADKKGEEKKGKGKKEDEIERFPDRIDRLRRQLEYTHSADPERQTLLWNSGVYANKADQTWRTQQPYIADRILAAAESLFRASDHLQHIAGAPGFPPPPSPPAEDVSRRLAQVYFRTREADFFLQEIHDNSASPLVSLLRQYYQRAVQAYDRSDFRGADEYGKAAEEIVKALENLAQAATLAPQARR